MTDQQKLAEALLKLAEAINGLSAKLPTPGLGGLTIHHQHHHAHSLPHSGGGAGGFFYGSGAGPVGL